MKRIYGVDIDFIDSLNESARACFPNEFLCMIRQKDGVVSEMVILPGTVFGDQHSFLSEWMAPIDYDLAGTAHSHPGFSNQASEQDKSLFSNMRGIHFITCQPYDRTSWKAYDSNGDEIDDLEIIYRSPVGCTDAKGPFAAADDRVPPP